MPSSKVTKRVNDLETLFPEIAKEADGWDPSQVLSGSHAKQSWKCNKGHRWSSTTKGRTTKGYGCPYCANRKVWIGFNDLKTFYPDISAEADGWDPSKVVSSSHASRNWKCSKGHKWKTAIRNRTLRKCNCPYCSNQKVLKGFNDLKTEFPEIAKQANGWDPAKVLSGSNKRFSWKCKLGHEWKTTSWERTAQKSGCPTCSNRKLLIGFNDLKTKFPEIAEEADGWNPSKVITGSGKRMNWKCKEGHKWKTSIVQRTFNGSGCPDCAESGFKRNKPAWFYLMKKEGEQQFGITNFISKRIKFHQGFNWIIVDKTGPHDGNEVHTTEVKLKKWIKKEVGLVPHKTENWYTSNLEVHSLAELKEKSGIETSIF